MSKNVAMEREIDNGFNVLYVDDEESNLMAFRAAFRRYCRTFIAETAEEGKSVLRTHDIHLVIADQRMPGVTGVEFLESVLEEFPDPVRILVTGYSDIEAVIAAINKAHVHMYVAKPWDIESLTKIIVDAYELYKLKQSVNRTVRRAVG